jgi:hypothetical protein
MSRLCEVVAPFRAYRERDITSDTWHLSKGDKFILVVEDQAWWTILTQSGLRYVWFAEFENSQVLE